MCTALPGNAQDVVTAGANSRITLPALIERVILLGVPVNHRQITKLSPDLCDHPASSLSQFRLISMLPGSKSRNSRKTACVKVSKAKVVTISLPPFSDISKNKAGEKQRNRLSSQGVKTPTLEGLCLDPPKVYTVTVRVLRRLHLGAT